MEQQSEKCCGATTDNPCGIGECPHFIKLNEACNCSQRLNRCLTQAETARALDLTRARIGQLEHSALGKLRRLFHPLSIEDFSLDGGMDEHTSFHTTQSSYVPPAPGIM